MRSEYEAQNGSQSMEEQRPRSTARGARDSKARLKKSAIEEVDPVEAPEEIEARHNHQWLLIQETLHTEKSYVRSLRQLVAGEVRFARFSFICLFCSEFL